MELVRPRGHLPAHRARHRPAGGAGAPGRPASRDAARGADRDRRGRRCAFWSTWPRGRRPASTSTSATTAGGRAGCAAGRRVLDAFCYTGGLRPARRPGRGGRVLGVDRSEPALELARANAELNGLASRSRSRRPTCSTTSTRWPSRGEQFGLVVLDPPKFARTRGAVEEALAATAGCRAWGCGCWSRTGSWSPVVAPA